MKCLSCSGDLEVRREARRYDACGLHGVVLADVEVRRCVSCGEEEIAIQSVAQLHSAIAKAIITRSTRLDPEEVKYLRKYLGWSGVDFAKHMGVAPETVSRWESGAQQINPTADRLLRLCVDKLKPIEDYSVELLANITDMRKTPETRIKLSYASNALWCAEAAIV